MARIANEEVARLRQEISVQRLAEARGVELKKRGTDVVGRCPFHSNGSDEAHLVINPKENIWSCSVCKTGGTCIEWVMRAEGISFRHAVELLREDHLPTAISNGRSPRKSTTPKLPAPANRDADDRVLLLEIARFYSEALKQSPEALKYLEGRGLQSSEMIDHFQLGFANRTLGYTLPQKNRAAGAELRGRLQTLGILRDTGHEQFNGSVTIPILADFERCGMVGEQTNKLVSYLAVTSRLLESPLAIVIQASSAAGKSALMEAVLAFMPEEQRVQYSAMTGQSLFYMGETDLKHKVLAIVEEEGATRASYALKLLQSEGAISIASTGKDSTTGRLVAQEYRVEGPVMIFLTTTAIDLDEELLNRCIVLSVDEDRTQTQAIHQKQREAQTLEGLLARQGREEILKLHRNAQRLLKPLFVVNPYARDLTFLDGQTRSRRDHTKYLTLIRAVALLHQYQRPRKTTKLGNQTVEYVEVTKEDIAVANRLAHEVLDRSLDDLPPQTRRLLLLLEEMIKAECNRLGIDRADLRFSRRDVRRYTGWGNTQLGVHLRRLQELEYLLVHRGGRGQSFVYELAFEHQDAANSPMLLGLINLDTLEHVYDENHTGQNGNSTGSKRPQNGEITGSVREGDSPALTEDNGNFGPDLEKATIQDARNEPFVVVEVSANGTGY